MAATTFTQLPRELRDMIWSTAAAIQYQQSTKFSIADSQPTSHTPPYPSICAERLRQAFIGYENLPEDVAKQPLRIYVHDTHSKDKLRLVKNEFKTLVNQLPMATVCLEARSHAIEFCRGKVGPPNLVYVVDEPGEPSDAGDEILKPILSDHKTVMVTNLTDEFQQPKIPGFGSAEHLVNVVSRVFGSSVEKIVFSSWVHTMRTIEEIYWPNTGRLAGLKEITSEFAEDRSQDGLAVFMGPDWTVCYTHEELDPMMCFDKDSATFVAQHLVKFREVVDASTHRLPLLQGIEMELQSACWDDILFSRIKAVKRNDVLWVDWRRVRRGYHHRFCGFNGAIPPSID